MIDLRPSGGSPRPRSRTSSGTAAGSTRSTSIPVPDGDTGTNLEQTMDGIVARLERSEAATTAQLAADVQRAATMEAKGNSGVILSHDRPRHGARPRRGRAGRRRCDGRGVPRRRDERVRRGEAAGGGDDADRDPRDGRGGRAPEVRALPLADGALGGSSRGATTPSRGRPSMLDKLREAGVVDAGGAGLVELARGVLHELTGEPLPEVPDVTDEITEESIHHEESEYRYCTVFVVEGDGLDLDGAACEPRAARRLAARHGRRVGREGARPHRRARGRARPGTRGRRRRRRARRDQRHAQPGRRAGALARAAPRRRAGAATPRWRSSPSRRASGNRESSAARARRSSIEGGQTTNPSVGQILEGDRPRSTPIT